MSSLRERKRVRTREALIDAAAELFERRGYDGTTIADIAAAADVSTRTFFSYCVQGGCAVPRRRCAGERGADRDR